MEKILILVKLTHCLTSASHINAFWNWTSFAENSKSLNFMPNNHCHLITSRCSFMFLSVYDLAGNTSNSCVTLHFIRLLIMESLQKRKSAYFLHNETVQVILGTLQYELFISDLQAKIVKITFSYLIIYFFINTSSALELDY